MSFPSFKGVVLSMGHAFLLQGLLLLCPFSLVAGAQPATSIIPDEKYFLFRLLEELPGLHAPTDASPQALERSLSSWRSALVRHAADLRHQPGYAELEPLFLKQIELVDFQASQLVSLGKLEQHVLNQQIQNGFDSGYAGGMAGSQAAALASESGFSDGESLLAGAAVGLFTYFADNQQRSDALANAQQEQLLRADRAWRTRWSDYQAQVAATALAPAEQHQWPRGSTGWDETPQEEARLAGLIASSDVRALQAEFEAQRRRRPQDPFAVARVSMLAPYVESDPARLAAVAEDCANAAAWVPARRIYDPYRHLLAYRAADTHVQAVGYSLKGKPRVNARHPLALRAIQYWDACLALDPGDATGELRERKAWMLMTSGLVDNVYALATEVAPLRGRTFRYHYNMAVLNTYRGDDNAALEHLDATVRIPGCEIKPLWTDLDLAPLRTRQKQRFENILKVNWKSEVVFGVLLDDVVLHNKSPFALTNVVYQTNIRSGNQWFRKELTVASIGPGQSHRWINVLSIPGGKIDYSSPSLRCDQSR
jgi:hypothetical protein